MVIVESPWSPPVFDVLGDEADRYSEMMKGVATRGGAIYLDLNRRAHLDPELFNDINHVNHAGARAYLSLIGPELHRLAQNW